MYLWRKLATKQWCEDAEEAIRARAGERMAVIELPLRKRITVEVTCSSAAEANALKRAFGGTVQKIRGDWWKKFSRPPQAFSMRIGERLVVSNRRRRRSRKGPPHILEIPAGLAFGTGEHATTAMSLRFVEEITRARLEQWSLADLGTGSGILALAARDFGAKHVYAIDNDPSAITVARQNAQRNQISGITFRVADATKWWPRRKVEVVAANLFSELLIKTLPNVRRYLAEAGQVVLSGILRNQEAEVLRALRRHRFQLVTVRRRGRWIALLARRS